MKNLVTREIKALAGKYSLRAVKQVWKLASEAKNPETRLKALELLLAYAHGKPSQTQLLGGTGGEPITTQHLADSTLGPDQELARRLALLQGIVGQSQDAQDAPSGARPMNGHSASVMPLDGRDESPAAPTGPAVGEVTVIDKDRGIALKRLTADGRADDGGNWQVVHGNKDLRVLRGITLPQARDVVAAMAADGRFDA